MRIPDMHVETVGGGANGYTRRAGFSVALMLLTLMLAAGCDAMLDLEPVDEIPAEAAVQDAGDARAVLRGAYNVLRSGAYYGGDFVFFGDLSADNAIHTGTFTSYASAARNDLRAANATIERMFAILYEGINRANVVLEKVPPLDDPVLSTEEKNEILGEAYFLRALHYHNLVKLWGPVPIITSPIESIEAASQVARDPVDAVYAQIISDLEQAEDLITNTSQTRRASLGAVKALLARVYLYRQEWAKAAARANEVASMGYELAEDFGALFTPDTVTPEAIFKVDFTRQDYNLIGYYYISAAAGGRHEVSPSQDIIDAFEEGDERRAWSIVGASADTAYATKYPTTLGLEDVHVLRFAEVLLIKAEALARQGRLEEAVVTYNKIRSRAGLDPHVFGVDVSTQQEVLKAIWKERRLELSFEGFRWANLNRTGRAVEVLGIPAFQTLYPIPQSEIEVTDMEQNPGY